MPYTPFAKVASRDPLNVLCFQPVASLGTYSMQELTFTKKTGSSSLVVDCNAPGLMTTATVAVPAQPTSASFAFDNLSPFTTLRMTVARSGAVLTRTFEFSDETGAQTKTWTVVTDASASPPTTTASTATVATAAPVTVRDDVPTAYSPAPAQLPRTGDLSSLYAAPIPASLLDAFVTGDYSAVSSADYESASAAALAASRVLLGLDPTPENDKPYNYVDLCILHAAAIQSGTPSAAIEALKAQSGSDPTLSTFPPLASSPTLPRVPTAPVRTLPPLTRSSGAWIPFPIDADNNGAGTAENTFEARCPTRGSASLLAFRKELLTRPRPWLVDYLFETQGAPDELLEYNTALDVVAASSSAAATIVHDTTASRTALATNLSSTAISRAWARIDDFASLPINTPPVQWVLEETPTDSNVPREIGPRAVSGTGTSYIILTPVAFNKIKSLGAYWVRPWPATGLMRNGDWIDLTINIGDPYLIKESASLTDKDNMRGTGFYDLNFHPLSAKVFNYSQGTFRFTSAQTFKTIDVKFTSGTSTKDALQKRTESYTSFFNGVSYSWLRIKFFGKHTQSTALFNFLAEVTAPGDSQKRPWFMMNYYSR